MKPKQIPWEIKPHTQAKHEILKKYLQAWMVILSYSNGRILYVDGFAGPGEYLNPQGGTVDGSPIIAIKSFLEHKLKDRIKDIIFIFIEENPDIFKYLEKKLEPYKQQGLKIDPIKGEFEEVLNKKLDAIEKAGKSIAPMFCFIDPFGIKGLSLETVKRIMNNKSCEVFINFMYEELNRFITLPENEDYVNALFGEKVEWKKIEDIKDPKDRYNYLTELYHKQLTTQIFLKK